MVIDVRYSDVNPVTGHRTYLIRALSYKPTVVGLRVVGSFQKRKKGEWFRLPMITEITPERAGNWANHQLWNGELCDSCDETMTLVDPELKREYWEPDVATFKIDMTYVGGGVPTSVTTPIQILANPAGPVPTPVKAQVSNDGKVIFLSPTGTFTFPVAMLAYLPVSVIGNNISVPDGVSGSDVQLVVCWGYPSVECGSANVDIPIPKN
jgi:hypothetical protein